MIIFSVKKLYTARLQLSQKNTPNLSDKYQPLSQWQVLFSRLWKELIPNSALEKGVSTEKLKDGLVYTLVKKLSYHFNKYEEPITLFL